VFKDLE
jgi:hypothetical protein